MAQQKWDSDINGGRREQDFEEMPSTVLVHSYSDTTLARLQRTKDDEQTKTTFTSGESRDPGCDSALPVFTNSTFLYAPKPTTPVSFSASTYADSLLSSRSNSPLSGPSVLSSATSASNFTIDTHIEPLSADSRRQPSILSRLKSSISTTSTSSHSHRRASVLPSDFQFPPEYPEKHFIDSVGMVIPGVSNRRQCAHPLAHFVTNWRLCQPIEYTTALADHGITYTDYCRLIAALEDFHDGIPNEPRYKFAPNDRWWVLRGWQSKGLRSEDGSVLHATVSTSSNIDSMDQFKRSEYHAANLNKLLAEISENWQKRGLPVMVCISSFSAFAPNRLSESHVQVLHVQLQPKMPEQRAVDDQGYVPRLSFHDPFDATNVLKADDMSVSVRPKIECRSSSLHSPNSNPANCIYHHHLAQQKDRTRPWPLWPNAIPMRKRELMHAHADRYGVDPHFRAYMRANVNARTKSSYTKWLIEKEDNPFINTRLEYATSRSGITLSRDLISGEDKKTYASITNRDNYEHNRRLECRKTVEHGSRLRIARFGFHHHIYPPHTPEMAELGLTADIYSKIISDIDDIRRNSKSNANCWAWLRDIRRRSPEDCLMKVSEYVRHVNAQQRRIVWTIEKIPGVYARGSGGKGKEWEISAWNGEDPLELLIQLERWGIIEKRWNIDDDGQ